jgi:hypothetical protein
MLEYSIHVAEIRDRVHGSALLCVTDHSFQISSSKIQIIMFQSSIHSRLAAGLSYIHTSIHPCVHIRTGGPTYTVNRRSRSKRSQNSVASSRKRTGHADPASRLQSEAVKTLSAFQIMYMILYHPILNNIRIDHQTAHCRRVL